MTTEPSAISSASTIATGLQRALPVVRVRPPVVVGVRTAIA
jgi:hypothetical protein